MEKTARYLIPALMMAAPAAVLAGGFALNEQSASAMGVANAGAAANPENATTVFFNPAGMSQLSGTNISFGAAVLSIDAEMKKGSGGATREDGTPVVGNTGGDIADAAILPNFYLTHEVSDWLDVGFGVHAPYGLAADYNDNFVGRFFADETELTAIAFSPSIALNDGAGFSLGFGVNVLYAEGKLSKFQDYSATSAQLGGYPLEDGYADVTGDDVGVTFSFGLLWEVNDRTQLGLSGQTGTELKLKGKAKIHNFPDVAIGPGGLDVNQVLATEKVKVPLNIPESLTFGIRHRATGSITLLAGATWSKWSRFEALDIISRERSGPVSGVVGEGLGDPRMVAHIAENWEDTWQVNVGGSWQATPEWAFKAGYAYDQSPVSDRFRTARIPSGDREWLTLGAQYAHLQSGWTVDVAAGVLLFDDTDVDERNYNVNDEPMPGAASFKGIYKLDAWSAGVQVSKAF